MPYRILGILICALMLLSMSCKKTESGGSDSSYSSVLEKTQSVEVVNPQRRSINADILITGTAMPNQTVELHAMESGYLSKMNVDIGDRVRKGVTIASLSNPKVAQRVSDARAAVTIAEAESKVLQSDLISADSDRNIKKDQYNRLNSIFQKTPQLTNVLEVEKLKGKAQIAEADYNSKKAMIAAQEQRIVALKAQLSNADVLNSMLQIRAPFSGVITKRWLDQGAMVQSGIDNTNSMPLVELQDLNPIRLMLQVSESDADGLNIGMDAKVTFPEMAGESIIAQVSRSSGVLDPASKTMQVEIDIDNENGNIISGMYAKVYINMGSQEEVLSVPQTALVIYQDEPHIWIVKDGIVRRLHIRKGLSGKDHFEILSAEVNAESQVIVKGKGLVKEGQIVQAKLLQQ
ncbi:MAG: RND family efflux transporter MFP subunit [Saprospiraceae bacterium]|jgi:RND family efflux transporter MFP subunit